MTIRVYRDAAGEYRWTLHAANGLTTADSAEGYSTYANALRAAKRFKSEVWRASIVDGR